MPRPVAWALLLLLLLTFGLRAWFGMGALALAGLPFFLLAAFVAVPVHAGGWVYHPVEPATSVPPQPPRQCAAAGVPMSSCAQEPAGP